MSVALTGLESLVLFVGRVLFGGVLAFMGLNHFLDAESMIGYAEMKGLPFPAAAVYLSGGALVVGGLSLATGAFPTIGAGALIAFFLIATPTMHDFWSVDDPEQQQQEMTQFLKNAALLGAGLVLLAVGGPNWAFAVGLAL